MSPSARTRIARREGGPAAAADRAGSGRARASVLAPAGPRRRWATALLAGAAVLASVAAGGWWAQRNSGADPQRPVTPLARTSAPVPPAAPVAVDWLAELARLDAARERAYAERDPARLAEVYASPVLLEQDRAQLGAQVPPDCGLDGARTQYTQLEVDSADGARASVQVTARLEAARVLCHGALQATTDPVGPVRLAITLTAGDDGRWRIDDQRLTG